MSNVVCLFVCFICIVCLSVNNRFVLLLLVFSFFSYEHEHDIGYKRYTF